MNHLQFSRMRVRRKGGVLLALLLMAGFISTVAPIASVSAGNTCTLSCCAGRAPHAAGSCMDGTCHAAIRLHQRRNVRTQPEERLCGVALRGGAVAKTTFRHQVRERDSQSSAFQTSSLTKPCQPDCGAGTFTSSSQSRPRDSGAISHADKPRPPSSGRLDRSSFNRANALDTLCRRSRPRGPPITFS